MKKYFNCKVAFDKTDENGMSKKVTENYIVDALSFTEAETRIVNEVQPYATGEFEITSVNRCNISDIIRDEDGSWYRCKLNYIVIDEERGIEKLAPSVLFVQGPDFNGAYGKCKEYINDSTSDIEIESITLSKVLEIFEYDGGN